MQYMTVDAAGELTLGPVFLDPIHPLPQLETAEVTRASCYCQFLEGSNVHGRGKAIMTFATKTRQERGVPSIGCSFPHALSA